MDKKRIERLLKALAQGLEERQDTLRLAFLSALSGESIFLLGPPGVAKSLIARRLKFAFKAPKAFEYLMNKFSTPDEIFGPVSIQQLKNDKYHRLTDHYLPGATVAFLDEIWKAGPSIQNTLLTVLNEKVYRNGAQEQKLPLKAVIAASNELPAEGEGLEALWDRFLVRDLVEGIQQQDAFERMIVSTQNLFEDKSTAADKFDDDDLKFIAEEAKEVEIPREVLGFIQMVRKEIEAYNNLEDEDGQKRKNLYVSDRRWKKILKMLRTSACLHSRKEVDLMDCFLVLHCIWSDPEQIGYLKTRITSILENHGYGFRVNLGTIKAEITKLKKEINQEAKFQPKPRGKTSPTTYQRQPIDFVVDRWNNKVVSITAKIREKEKELLLFQKEKINSAKENLFVPTEVFSLLETNLQNILKRVEAVEIELQKVQHSYKNIRHGESL